MSVAVKEQSCGAWGGCLVEGKQRTEACSRYWNNNIVLITIWEACCAGRCLHVLWPKGNRPWISPPEYYPQNITFRILPSEYYRQNLTFRILSKKELCDYFSIPSFIVAYCNPYLLNRNSSRVIAKLQPDKWQRLFKKDNNKNTVCVCVGGGDHIIKPYFIFGISPFVSVECGPQL